MVSFLSGTSGNATLLSSLCVPSLTAATSLLGTSEQTTALKWQYVTRRFTHLLANITITAPQLEDGAKKHHGIRSALNSHYWGYDSDNDNSLLIGSWGKETRVRPSRDVDVLFLLPGEIFHRFQQRVGNRQSQLLQEVKAVLGNTYPQTAMRGDGQVVIVPFNTRASNPG